MSILSMMYVTCKTRAITSSQEHSDLRNLWISVTKSQENWMSKPLFRYTINTGPNCMNHNFLPIWFPLFIWFVSSNNLYLVIVHPHCCWYSSTWFFIRGILHHIFSIDIGSSILIRGFHSSIFIISIYSTIFSISVQSSIFNIDFHSSIYYLVAEGSK